MPRLLVMIPGQAPTPFELDAEETGVGREPDSTLVLPHESVSRKHALISRRDGAWWLTDLGSTNGIVVNDRRIAETELLDGTEMAFGEVTCVFENKPVQAAPALPSPPAPSKLPLKRVLMATASAAVILFLCSILHTARQLPSQAPPKVAVVVELARKGSDVSKRNQAESGEPVVAPVPPRASTLQPPTTAGPMSVQGLAHESKLLAKPLPEPPIQPLSAKTSPPPAAQPPPETLLSLPAPSPTVPAGASTFSTPKSTIAAKPVALQIPATPPPEPGELFFDHRPGRSDPVISPDLRHVMYFIRHLEADRRPEKFKDEPFASPPEVTDLYLDRKLVLTSPARIAQASDIHFSPDSSAWLVTATDPDIGRPLLLQGSRSLRIEGELIDWAASTDFAVIATVVRFEDADRLYLNNVLVSGNQRISDLHLSADGRQWAYVAQEDPGASNGGKRPRAWLKSDDQTSDTFEAITSLAMNAQGGHLAYVGLREQFSDMVYDLIVDGRREHTWKADVVAPGGLVFSPDGRRFGYCMRMLHDPPVFVIDGKPVPLSTPLEAELGPFGTDGGVYSVSPLRFSLDGRHTAFAIAGTTAIVCKDGVEMGRYPGVVLDSLMFSRTGHLAFITSKGKEPLRNLADGSTAQLRTATLWTDSSVLQTIPILDTTRPLFGHLVFGGFTALQFSPDGQHLACLVKSYAGKGVVRDEGVWVDGRDMRHTQGSPQPNTVFCWSADHTIRVLRSPAGGAIMSALVDVPRQ